ncbi:MAG: sensor histidine kinase, partial [Peptococcaceae bacterium]
TFYYALLLDNGQILRVSHTMHSLWLNIFSSLPYVLLFAVLVLLVALLLVHREVQRIVVPINELDLEHPVDNIVYDELSPLLQRISRQNMQISNQMKELAERQQEFSTLTENMNEGLVIVNAHGYILSINRRALQIFGLKEDDYLQKHILVVNRNLELKQTIENGLKGQNQELLLDLEGRKYQIMSNPILIAGHARGLVLLLLDVTEKQQQEQMRREFTANVSHELRTPMTAISGYAEIMMQGLVQPQDMKPFAEKIYKEANRLISLIADIIQLSQLDEGGSQFQMQQVALDMVMEEVEQRLQPLAEKKDVTLTMLAEPVTVQGNRQVLQEILYNLCENAIKYNKPQGTVQMSLQQLDGKAVVTVADTGIGIPVEEQQRVFERFYRVDKSHSRIIGGTGLGLSIVKHGVQMHHGEISMESELWEGTRIVVRLPLM